MSISQAVNDISALGQYLTSAPAVPAGGLSPLRVDVDSVLLVRDVGATPTSLVWYRRNTQAGRAIVLTGAPPSGAYLLSIQGYNLSASTRYLQVFDTAALPQPNGALPDYAPIECPPYSNFSVLCQPASGYQFVFGITWIASSTAGFLTNIATDDLFVTAVYR